MPSRLAAWLCLPLALSVAAPANAWNIMPHRAVYEVDLLSVRNRSQVGDVEGLMAFQWADACNGWTVEQTYWINFFYTHGEQLAVTSNYATWETYDGDELAFTLRSTADGEVDIRVRFPTTDRSLAQLEQFRIPTGQGLVPIRNFVEFRPAPRTGTLQRVDARRVVTVNADVAEGPEAVQEIEGVGFLESVRMLAERYGIPLPEEEVDQEAANERESILHALRFAARFFYHQLTQTDRGQPALDYLRGRGYEPSTIKQFGLGYAPDEWDALLTAAEDEQLDPEILEKAGLVVERNDGSGYYDRYRGRIIFPIFSHIGKVLAFAGRILDQDKDQPKYINSPETKVYHKKDVLYGLNQAKRAIRKTDEVLLVEGYTDVISLSQAGVENVVASSGTALTEGQVQTLHRYAKRVLLLYDADEAGSRATMRGMDRVLEQGMGSYAVELPDGQDPDDFVQEKGGDAFAEYVEEHRQDLPSFAYQRARRSGGLDTPEDRVEVQRDIIESVARIPDPNLRREYVTRTSEVVNVPDSDLFRMLEEERERLEFMAAQRDDLAEAEDTLLETISEINTTAAERFETTFAAIRENFRRIYTRLFGEGATADLVLEDADNPLDSAIEIMAKPRGKRPSIISQLSSGEKTLTAIALLFAIYLVKPSPFCVLDEVDAPLDDMNVERFMQLIKEFSSDTQFIVVTHNKLTMQAADRLYGVTMQEQGVSQLVGVEFDEAMQMVG